MASTSPQILRPIPRRPYEQNSSSNGPPSPLLAPADAGNPPSETPSRAHSFLNLTSSTLLGIYSQTGYGERSDEPSTPWGTGAETPSSPGNYLSTMPPNQRRQSIAPQFKPQEKHDPVADAARLGSKTVLLFALGMGYGSLVKHLHNDRGLAAFQVEGIIKPRDNWTYLFFWGVAGVALGSLLPWVDGFFGGANDINEVEQKERKKTEDSSSGGLSVEWTPVVRSFGAFVGIAFAIRKLPWASTLQASLTLALVNPFLWYLVDRSKPGFILSTCIGLTGTALLLASNPDMMPTPASHASRNTSIHHTQILSDLSDTWGVSAVVSRETVEGAVWIWSVLFCSCVCFGNIGRMLALSSSKRDVNDLDVVGNGSLKRRKQ